MTNQNVVPAGGGNKPLDQVTNNEFIEVFFGDHVDDAYTVGFTGDPVDPKAPKGRWFGNVWSKTGKRLVSRDPNTGGEVDPAMDGVDTGERDIENQNNYICVSSFTPENGKVRRVHRLCKALHFLVIDDVGDPTTSIGAKISREHVEKWFVDNVGAMVEPTAIVETSPGSYQYFYGFAEPFAGHAYAALAEERWTAITKSMNVTGKDPGNGDTTRLVRLPVGINGKAKYLYANGVAPKCALRAWHPDRLRNPDKFAKLVLKVTDSELARVKAGVHVTTKSANAPKAAEYEDPAEDPTGWGKALNDLGLLRSTTTAGVWQITCPFVDEHTGGEDTGAAFRGDGCFNCFHSCRGRDQNDYRNKFYELYPELRQAVAQGVFECIPVEDEVALESRKQEAWKGRGWKPGDASPEELVERFVWLKGGDAWFDLLYRKTITKPEFNTTFGGIVRERLDAAFAHQEKGKRPAASDCLVQAPELKVANAVEYAPGRPAFYEDKAKSKPGAPHFVVNKYQPSVFAHAGGVSLANVDEKFKARVLELFEMLVEQLTGDTGDKPSGMDWRLYNWLALMVGDPSEKPGWQWLITSKPSLGKDTLAEVIARLVGEENATAIGQVQIAGDFNAYASKKLIRVNDLAPANMGRQSALVMYDQLKPFLSNQPLTVEINPKYGKTFEAWNVGGYFFFSNNAMPLVLDENERRLCVINRHEAKNQMKEKGLWPEFHRNFTKGPRKMEAHQVLYDFLVERFHAMTDAAREDLRGNAPGTEAKADIIAAGSGGMLEELMDALVADRDVGPIVTPEEIGQWLDSMAGGRGRFADVAKRTSAKGFIYKLMRRGPRYLFETTFKTKEGMRGNRQVEFAPDHECLANQKRTLIVLRSDETLGVDMAQMPLGQNKQAVDVYTNQLKAEAAKEAERRSRDLLSAIDVKGAGAKVAKAEPEADVDADDEAEGDVLAPSLN